MLFNVFTKTVRDRAIGMTVGAVSIGFLLWMGMAIYRDVDTSFYYQLPAAVLELMGIPPAGDVAGIAFGAMYNLMGAFTLAGLAISMGASAIAGEEKAGTLGLLLGNPLSRRGVLFSKAGSLLAVTLFGALILWGFALVVPQWLQVDMTGIEVEATMIALFLNALVYGFLAMAVGSWTGSRNGASGVAVGVMLAGYLAASLLPLTEFDGLARIFPWHYFNGDAPVVNGANWAHFGIMTAMIVVFLAIAVVAVTRRDLREKSADTTIFDRLRENPRTGKIIERISGSTRVSRISIKTTSEFQGMLVITATVMFYMGLMMGPLYGLVPIDIVDFFNDFPDALIAMIGGADMGTAAGFIQAEIFSITGPVVFIIVTAAMGSRGLAGEEESHTMGLLLSNPISRAHVLVEKTIAMLIYSAALGVVTFLGTWIGARIGGLDLTAVEVGATSALLALLGLVFGGLALAIGAATGRSRVAAGTTAGVAVLAYFLWSFLPLSDRFAGWMALSPFHYFLGSDPLVNGMAWDDAAVLGVVFVLLVTVANPLFARRDLRG